MPLESFLSNLLSPEGKTAGLLRGSTVSVYLREGSSLWQINIPLPGGKSIRRSSRTRDKKEAERIDKSMRVALGLETVFENQGMKFKELWTRCMVEWKTVCPKSFTRHHKSHQDVLLFQFGEMKLDQIKPLHILDWRTKRSEEVAPATVNRGLTVLRRAFNLAITWGLMEKNPMKIDLMKEPPGRLRFLNYSEQIKLLDVIKNFRPNLYGMALIALRTGMRRGEILSLRVRDIDFDRKMISLMQTKNGFPRHIPVPLSVEALLKTLCSNKTPKDFVISKIGCTNLWKDWQRSIKYAGLTDFRFHDLRHTYASDMLAAGCSLVALKELMGHSTIDMTLRYAHLAPDFKRQEVNKLNMHLGKLEESVSQSDCEEIASQKNLDSL